MPVERLTSAERARLDEFARIVRQAQREIATTIQLATRAGDLSTASRQRAQLARVVAVLDELGTEIDPRARRIVQDAWQRGAVKAASDMANIGVPADFAATLSFNGVAGDAVRALQEAIVGRLADSRVYIGRQTQDIYAAAGKRAALRAVLGVDGSVASARRQLAADLLKNKQLARTIERAGKFRLPGGSRYWSMADYTDVVVRTTTREATVQGAMARMASNGIQLARVSTHSGACPICVPYEGRLVSIAGSAGEFEGEAVMAGPTPPFHPRCRHSLAPVASRIDAIRRDLAGSVG